jgi:hypothetical protein
MAALQTKLPRLTLLSDPGLAGLAAWGVLFPGDEHPIPATFIVDAGGTVRWRYFYNASGDWPPYADLAAALGSK